jgi:hypothetical protein
VCLDLLTTGRVFMNGEIGSAAGVVGEVTPGGGMSTAMVFPNHVSPHHPHHQHVAGVPFEPAATTLP